MQALEAALTAAPLLMLPRSNEPYEMHTDARISPSAPCCIRQMPLRASCAPLPTSPNSYLMSERYATHKRKLLAEVHVLKVWRMGSGERSHCPYEPCRPGVVQYGAQAFSAPGTSVNCDARAQWHISI